MGSPYGPKVIWNSLLPILLVVITNAWLFSRSSRTTYLVPSISNVLSSDGVITVPPELPPSVVPPLVEPPEIVPPFLSPTPAL